MAAASGGLELRQWFSKLLCGVFIQCNNDKSDHLAAEEHLAAWMERTTAQGDKLRAMLQAAVLPCDFSASLRIARWAYEQTEKSKGQVWVEKKLLRQLGPAWRQLLVA